MYKLLLMALLAGGLAACKGNDTAAAGKAYEAQKQSLADEERSRPLHFLQVRSDDKKNWIGQTVVHGAVKNTATVCSYKNIRLKLLCYDAAGKLSEEHEDVIDNILKPGTSKAFTLRYRLPRGTDSIALSIMSAGVEK